MSARPETPTSVNQVERSSEPHAERTKEPGPLEPALQEFHEASFGWALACCCGNRHEAEEVLQTSYLKAIEGRARFNGHSSMRTWFFGVVRRTAAEQRRRHAVRRLALVRWLAGRPVDDPAPTPESVSSDGEASRRLRALLSRLSPRQSEVLHLVFYQELTIEEAADVLHLPVGTARTHYERGKARLKLLLLAVGLCWKAGIETKTDRSSGCW
jgi:RNA polymerase sigma-70 factor (ECF subfamily)